MVVGRQAAQSVGPSSARRPTWSSTCSCTGDRRPRPSSPPTLLPSFYLSPYLLICLSSLFPSGWDRSLWSFSAHFLPFFLSLVHCSVLILLSCYVIAFHKHYDCQLSPCVSDRKLFSVFTMAMNKARANVRLPPEVNRVLYVRNLPYKITAEEMYDIFGKYGAIRQIRSGTSYGESRHGK